MVLPTRLFPAPQMLAMPTVGVDISDASVKYAALVDGPKGLTLGKYGDMPLAPGIVTAGGKIEKPEALAAVLAKIKKESGFAHVVAALPEEQAYLIRLSLPYMQEGEIRGAIELQLEEHVPLAPSDVIFDYEIAKKPANEKEAYEVNVTVLPKGVVGMYLDAFVAADMHPIAFEIEAHAIARAVLARGRKEMAMIVDMGKTRTGFAIADGTVVWFSSTVALGGDDITKAIEKGIGVSYQEAEKLKMSRGFSRAPADSEMFAILVPIMAALKDEISKHYIYWQTHKDESGMARSPIEKIVLCGGQANFPGLAEYLSLGLGVRVEQANPWVNMLSFEEAIPTLSKPDSLRYATALGLALRAHSELLP